MMLASGARLIDLDCGIACARIVSWLDDELALPRNDGGWIFAYEHRTCLVEVEPLESRAFGSIALERSRLTAKGDAEALAVFDRLFTLRFISAGG